MSYIFPADNLNSGLKNLAVKEPISDKEILLINVNISTSFLLLHSLYKTSIKKGSLSGFESKCYNNLRIGLFSLLQNLIMNC
jgi:hypothetical protein